MNTRNTEKAKELLTHYFQYSFNGDWYHDNTSETHSIVDLIVAAAVDQAIERLAARLKVKLEAEDVATDWVVREMRCQVCEGEGVIYNPLWAATEPIYMALFNKEISDQEYIEKMNKHFGVECQSERPPEEIECPTCKGRGTIRGEINLTQALVELLGG